MTRDGIIRGVSLYAKDAVIGGVYVTSSGYPVVILQHGDRETYVQNKLNGRQISIPNSQLLWPFKKHLVSEEARALSRPRLEKNTNKINNFGPERSLPHGK